jgi:hypothetical protein
MAAEPKVQPKGEPMQLEGAPEGATEQTVQPEQQVDIDSLVQTLEKIGVRDAQHLEGLHRTAQAHGPTAQELGYARQEIARLQQEMESLKSRPQRSADPYADPYEQGQGQPIDLRGEIKTVLRDFYRDEVIQPQQQASERYWQDVETVQGSEYYPVVQDEYEAHMRQPSVQRALAQGRTSHTNEFHKAVSRKFRDIAQNLKSAASMLKEQAPRGTQPPHMETGQVSPERLPEREEAKRKQMEEIQKKARGTDDDIDAMLKAIIPDGDPLLRT